jgi:hypothetical protein
VETREHQTHLGERTLWWFAVPRNPSPASIRREIEAATTVAVSFPKAGRSWLCYFLARYAAERTGAPFGLDLVLDGRVMPPLRFSHEHIDVFGNVAARSRLLCEDVLLRRRLLVLIRDPRDTVVSYWHQRRLRERLPVPDSLARFATSPVYGIERVSEATALLLDLYERHPGDKLLVRYEALVADPARGLTDVLRFALDGRPVDAGCLRNAIAASRFERMRSWERSLPPDEVRRDGRFGARGGRGDARFKVRRGVVGGYTTEMAPTLQERLSALPQTAALLRRLYGPRNPDEVGISTTAGDAHSF